MTELAEGVFLGDCRRLLKRLEPGSVELVIADPPYNIGFDYGEEGYKDSLPPEDYRVWCQSWIQAVAQVLTPTGSFWLIIGDEWVADLRILAREAGLHLRNWVVWYYTFGVNCKKKFTRSHAHLLYLVKDPNQFTFNVDEVRIPSARQLVYNDRRAEPSGRLPDDTWILRPQEVPEIFQEDEDVWTVPRVCGTFKQRQIGAANQLPEQLVARIIRACSNSGDMVLDPFVGTGTVPATAKKLGRAYLGAELYPKFAEMARDRIRQCNVGDPLDGAT